MKFIRQYWFLISLFAAIALGFWFRPQLVWLESAHFFRSMIVFVVMFAMAIAVEFRTFVDVLRRPGPAVTASLLNMAWLPALFFLTTFLISPELGAGFLVVGATPCTLATASVWTRKAGGNDAVSMFVTIITNGTCFFISPLLLWLTLGGRSQVDVIPIILKLFYLVIIPIGLAQLARLNSSIARFASNQRTLLSVVAQVGILIIVVIGSLKTRELYDQGSADLGWKTIILVVFVATVVHCLALGSGLGLSKVLQFDRKDQIAVGIAGSQKTLMIGLLLCLQVGVTIVPLVVYHTMQLLIDAVFATIVREKQKSNGGLSNTE